MRGLAAQGRRVMLDNKAKKLIALVIGCSIVSATAVASEIYRYTDEDGTVHYGDRPSGESDEQRVAIDSRPTDNAAVQQRYDDRYGDRTTSSSEGETTETEEAPRPTRAERRAAAAEKQVACDQSRAQLERFESARRLYREQENGERHWMTDEEIDATRQRARALVEENCN